MYGGTKSEDLRLPDQRVQPASLGLMGSAKAAAASCRPAHLALNLKLAAKLSLVIKILEKNDLFR